MKYNTAPTIVRICRVLVDFDFMLYVLMVKLNLELAVTVGVYAGLAI